MELMLGVLMILASRSFGAPVTSYNISVHCEEGGARPERAPLTEFAPSKLANLEASVFVEDGRHMLNMSWAINVDSTFEHIKATHIYTTPDNLMCTYTPPLKEAFPFLKDRQEKIWFHHIIYKLNADYYDVQASNIPLPPPENGLAYIVTIVHPPIEEPEAKVTTPLHTIATPAPVGCCPLLVPVGGGLFFGLVLLLFGFITYKMLLACLTVSFQKMAKDPKVPVLVVYPAESAVFQGAVVALAEFLQQHGGCQVGIDMWQQGSVAKLGPMRWLMDQVNMAHRVIIVTPQASSDPLSQKLPSPGASIPPAAAQDLYPLALNLVASRAKNRMELAKFWVVRFEETGPLTSELQACRTFCLIKDLNKLCRGLQRRREGMKIVDLLMRRANWCGQSCTEKLRAAVQALHGAQASVVKDQDSDKRSKLLT